MTKFLDTLELLIKGLAGLCLAAVLALMIAQVASRFLFNFSLAAASELSIYAIIWCVFLAASVAFRNGDHIAMDFIVNSSPKKLKIAFSVIVYVLVTVFLVIIVFKGYDLSLRAMRQISTASSLPVGYISIAMPICSVLALIFLTEHTIKQLSAELKND
ncbi:TRAP transporter small permease [Leucothrix sargassi]|nr:TRAP transporter small permease [Leucothrix sargassi]